LQSAPHSAIGESTWLASFAVLDCATQFPSRLPSLVVSFPRVGRSSVRLTTSLLTLTRRLHALAYESEQFVSRAKSQLLA